MLALTTFLALLLAGPAGPHHVVEAEAPPVEPEEGLLLRIDGDLDIPRGQHVDAIVVIGGTARVAGSAGSVVVVDGTAELTGARVDEMVVVDGRAVLRGGSTVARDVTLIGSSLERDESSAILGTVQTEAPWKALGFWITGVLLPLGLVIALVLAGLAIAALVPHGVRRAEAALTRDVGKTLLAALILWIALPIAIALSFAAVFTIPAGIGVLVFVLPAIAFFGYIIVGIRIGDAVLGGARRRNEAQHPYLAALIGIPLLALIGVVPVIGGLVTVLAAIVGGGAILLAAWRSVRRTPTAVPVTALPSPA